MNRKGDIGGAITTIVIIVIIIYFATNYVRNTDYKEIFKICNDFCGDRNMTYNGVQSVASEKDRSCVCETYHYPVYRTGLSDFKVIGN